MLKPFKLFFVVFLMFAFITPVALASEPSAVGKWWQAHPVVNRLELTDNLIDGLENLFYEHSQNLILLKNAVETEQYELQVIMEAEPLDVEKARAQHEKLEIARGKLATERFEYFLEIRKILGFEKFRKLVELKKQRAQNRNR